MFNHKNTNKYLHKITNGNCKKVLAEFDANTIDLVITSPPYDDLRDYTKEAKWNYKSFQETAKQLFRVMKPGGMLVWVVGDKVDKGNKSLTSFRQALYFHEIGFNMFDVIIYEKAGSGPPHKNRYFNTYEYMFVLSKGQPKTINLLKDKKNKWANHLTYGNVTRREKDGTLTNKGRKIVNEMGVRTNIWKYTNGKGFSTKDEIAYQHPAIFPEKLVQDHILSWSNEGDIVLDPFGGSGTVAKKAIELNRQWISIEISKEDCKLAEKRIKSVLCNTEQ
jgi:site-specific DNA-methyltransferase (adenine-specific)